MMRTDVNGLLALRRGPLYPRITIASGDVSFPRSSPQQEMSARRPDNEQPSPLTATIINLRPRAAGEAEQASEDGKASPPPMQSGRDQPLHARTAPAPLPPRAPRPHSHHHLQLHLADAPSGTRQEEKRAGTSYRGKERGRASTPSRGKAAAVDAKETRFGERNRREKMNEMYEALQSMVPNVFPRAPRARIVDETINYIEALEGTIREMEAAKKAKKKARMSSAASGVDVTVSGKMALFGVSSVWRPRLAAHILQVFEKHDAEVLAATVAFDGGQSTSSDQNMKLSITTTVDEAKVEGIEEALVKMLS